MIAAMTFDLLIIGVFALCHVSMLQTVPLYLGSLAETSGVPMAIIRSKYHVLGLLALTLGLIVIVGSAHAGLLGYGILVGTGLFIIDMLLVYRACIEWARAR